MRLRLGKRLRRAVNTCRGLSTYRGSSSPNTPLCSDCVTAGRSSAFLTPVLSLSARSFAIHRNATHRATGRDFYAAKFQPRPAYSCPGEHRVRLECRRVRAWRGTVRLRIFLTSSAQVISRPPASPASSGAHPRDDAQRVHTMRDQLKTGRLVTHCLGSVASEAGRSSCQSSLSAAPGHAVASQGK